MDTQGPNGPRQDSVEKIIRSLSELVSLAENYLLTNERCLPFQNIQDSWKNQVITVQNRTLAGEDA